MNGKLSYLDINKTQKQKYLLDSIILENLILSKFLNKISIFLSIVKPTLSPDHFWPRQAMH